MCNKSSKMSFECKSSDLLFSLSWQAFIHSNHKCKIIPKQGQRCLMISLLSGILELLCATKASALLLLSTWWNYWRFTNQPASYALLLILPFFDFPGCACTHLVRDLFLMLHHLSGQVSFTKLGHQTHSHLSNHLWNLTSSNYPIDCVYAWGCCFRDVLETLHY